MVVRGFYKLMYLLAAVALEQIHGIYRYCVASNVIFIHGGLLNFAPTLYAGPPLYTGNNNPVITPYVVVSACRLITLNETTDPGDRELPLTFRPTIRNHSLSERFPSAKHSKV